MFIFLEMDEKTDKSIGNVNFIYNNPCRRARLAFSPSVRASKSILHTTAVLQLLIHSVVYIIHQQKKVQLCYSGVQTS